MISPSVEDYIALLAKQIEIPQSLLGNKVRVNRQSNSRGERFISMVCKTYMKNAQQTLHDKCAGPEMVFSRRSDIVTLTKKCLV